MKTSDSELKELLEQFALEYIACEDEKYYTEGQSNIWAGKRANEILDKLNQYCNRKIVEELENISPGDPELTELYIQDRIKELREE